MASETFSEYQRPILEEAPKAGTCELIFERYEASKWEKGALTVWGHDFCLVAFLCVCVLQSSDGGFADGQEKINFNRVGGKCIRVAKLRV